MRPAECETWQTESFQGDVTSTSQIDSIRQLHSPALQAGRHRVAVQDCLEVHHEAFAIPQPALRELPPAGPVFVMRDCDYYHVDWRKIVQRFELNSVLMLEFRKMRERICRMHVNAERL
jgi:hypothetical protein